MTESITAIRYTPIMENACRICTPPTFFLPTVAEVSFFAAATIPKTATTRVVTLTPPAVGARIAADEHQHDGHQPARLGKFVHGDGVVSRRSRRYRLEERGKNALRQREIPEGMVRLRKEEEYRAAEDERQRGGDDDLRMQAVFFETEFTVYHVAPDDKAQPADDDEKHDGEIDDRIPHVRGKRRKKVVRRTQKVEPRVAERRHGVKDRVIYTPAPAEISHETVASMIAPNASKTSVKRRILLSRCITPLMRPVPSECIRSFRS